MPIYECELCQFQTKIKTHFNRHINTPKHKRKYLNSKINTETTKQTESKLDNDQPQKQLDIQPENTVENDEKKIKITIKDVTKKDTSLTTKVYLDCEFCGRKLSTKGHLARHIKSYCPALKTKKESNLLKDMLEEQKQQLSNKN